MTANNLLYLLDNILLFPKLLLPNSIAKCITDFLKKKTKLLYTFLLICYYLLRVKTLNYNIIRKYLSLPYITLQGMKESSKFDEAISKAQTSYSSSSSSRSNMVSKRTTSYVPLRTTRVNTEIIHAYLGHTDTYTWPGWLLEPELVFAWVIPTIIVGMSPSMIPPHLEMLKEFRN